MRVGCVKEIKNNEFRVGMTPDNVKNYVRAGHEVYIERDAGVGSGFTTEQYEKAGAHILDQAKDVWDKSEMMIKVKAVSYTHLLHMRKKQAVLSNCWLSARSRGILTVSW